MDRLEETPIWKTDADVIPVRVHSQGYAVDSTVTSLRVRMLAKETKRLFAHEFDTTRIRRVPRTRASKGLHESPLLLQFTRH